MSWLHHTRRVLVLDVIAVSVIAALVVAIEVDYHKDQQGPQITEIDGETIIWMPGDYKKERREGYQLVFSLIGMYVIARIAAYYTDRYNDRRFAENN